MEVLVVIAIILVLAAIIFPVYRTVQVRANKARATARLRDMAQACMAYAASNNNTLPEEDSKGTDDWQTAAKPENQNAWYNALPRIMGKRGVGEYAKAPRDYYTSENVLFLPGAGYPDDDSKYRDPLFAFAINTKLHRKNEDGKKQDVLLTQITHPSKTVLFLEQGLPGENKAMSSAQPKYDGSCKGSAKSFVARYAGEGIIVFVDGRAESINGKEILTESGEFHFPQEEIIWTRTPEENPNKSDDEAL